MKFMLINLFSYYSWYLLFIILGKVICFRINEQIFFYCWIFNELSKIIKCIANSIRPIMHWLGRIFDWLLLDSSGLSEFFKNFNENVLGYYIGLLGLYFAILIVVVQTYSKKRYLGYDVSNWVLLDHKFKNKSLILIIWICSSIVITLSIVFNFFKCTWINLLIFIVYFWIMVFEMGKYIKVLTSNSHIKNIENEFLNKISEESSFVIAKSLYPENTNELIETINFFVEQSKNEKFIEENEQFIEIFKYFEDEIFKNDEYVKILLGKMDITVDSLRRRYFNLPIIHSKMSEYLKYNINDQNFIHIKVLILKMIESQIHLTTIASNSYSLIFKYYLSIINLSKNVSEEKKLAFLNSVNTLLREINDSDNKAIIKVKYYIDYISTIIDLNLTENFKELTFQFNNLENEYLPYVLAITYLILYINECKELIEYINDNLEDCICYLDKKTFIEYVDSTSFIFQKIYYQRNCMTEDENINSKVEIVKKYFVLKKYELDSDIDELDKILFSGHLDNDTTIDILINELNDFCDFVGDTKINREQVKKYKDDIVEYIVKRMNDTENNELVVTKNDKINLVNDFNGQILKQYKNFFNNNQKCNNYVFIQNKFNSVEKKSWIQSVNFINQQFREELQKVIYETQDLEILNVSDISKIKDKNNYFVLCSSKDYRAHSELRKFSLFNNFSYWDDKEILIINKLNFFINDIEINEEKIENFPDFNGTASIEGYNIEISKDEYRKYINKLHSNVNLKIDLRYSDINGFKIKLKEDESNKKGEQ